LQRINKVDSENRLLGYAPSALIFYTTNAYVFIWVLGARRPQNFGVHVYFVICDWLLNCTVGGFMSFLLFLETLSFVNILNTAVTTYKMPIFHLRMQLNAPKPFGGQDLPGLDGVAQNALMIPEIPQLASRNVPPGKEKKKGDGERKKHRKF